MIYIFVRKTRLRLEINIGLVELYVCNINQIVILILITMAGCTMSRATDIPKCLMCSGGFLQCTVISFLYWTFIEPTFLELGI